MELNKEKLRTLLAERKLQIKSKTDIFSTLAALLTYIGSVVLSVDFLSLPLKKQIVIIVIGLFYATLAIYAFITSRYSAETLYHEILACTDEHNFSLLLLKDKRGRFLLKYDKRWKTYLFPYTHTQDNDEQSVRDFVNNSLKLSQIDIKTSKEDDFTKTSVSANMTKTYHQKFYLCDFDLSQLPQKDCFKVYGTKYKWFSIDDMKINKSVWRKNSETFEYVEKKF